MHARESTLENRYEGWIRKVEPEANPCLPSERRAPFFLEKNVSPYRERNFLRSRSILSDTKEKIKGIVNCERRDASRKIVAGILRDERR